MFYFHGGNESKGKKQEGYLNPSNMPHKMKTQTGCGPRDVRWAALA